MLRRLLAILLLVGCCRSLAEAAAPDPLPSWNDSPRKAAILDFVTRVTTAGGDDFVEPSERIATFDNDGTLWCEQPNYVQGFFLVDRIQRLAAEHPEWKTTEPFAALLKGDMRAALAGGEQGIADVVSASHAGMSTGAFEKLVTDWLATARHPRFKRPFTECVYQPMLELVAYFRSRGFKTYLVSGGGIDFMRPWTPRVYGIPPEQVVGSSITHYELADGVPRIVRLPHIEFIDDGPGKPLGIDRYIGRRPIAAFGNSDGDFEMLQWTTAGPGPRFGLIVHHTDAVREYAYDRDSPVGRLDKALDQAPKSGWLVVDMKHDWKTIFPSDKPAEE
jgi:hypothetical protein